MVKKFEVKKVESKKFDNRKNEDTHRINKEIRLQEVRIIGDIENSGTVVSIQEALKIANSLNLDLVEISPNTIPPICKVVDYSKFLYDVKRKKKEQEKKQKDNSQLVKEIRFGPNTDEHDYNFKKNHAINFLKDNNIVKAFVFFKGREIQYKENGEILLLRLADDLADIGIPDNAKPKLEGKKMILYIKPKKKK
jgi:translation initiation factor IF-3